MINNVKSAENEKVYTNNIIRSKETGITLIALVVTIIVLLILAGVTISIAIDNGGLIGRAKDARIMQTIADIKDTAEMIRGDYELGNEGEDATADYIINQLIAQEKIKSNQVVNDGRETGIGILNVEGKEVQIKGRIPGITIRQAYEDDWIGRKITYTSDNGESNWIILGKDNNNDILITTEQPVNSYTSNHTLSAWCDYENNLNNICSAYTGKIGRKNVTVKKARSINMDDVLVCIGATIPETFDEYTFTTESGDKNVNYYYPDETNKTWIKPDANHTWTHKNDPFQFSIYSYTPSTGNNTIGYKSINRQLTEIETRHPNNFIFLEANERYWIATRFVGIQNNQAAYSVASSYVSNGVGLDFPNKSSYCFASSGENYYRNEDNEWQDGEDWLITCPVRPVVVLQGEILYDDVNIYIND